MIINIEYPQVMKMIMTEDIKVDDAASLDQIKEEILQSFWHLFLQNFPSAIARHGKKENIVLKDKDVEITSDTILQERLTQTHCFQAIFTVHPPNHQKATLEKRTIQKKPDPFTRHK